MRGPSRGVVSEGKTALDPVRGGTLSGCMASGAMLGFRGRMNAVGKLLRRRGPFVQSGYKKFWLGVATGPSLVPATASSFSDRSSAASSFTSGFAAA